MSDSTSKRVRNPRSLAIGILITVLFLAGVFGAVIAGVLYADRARKEAAHRQARELNPIVVKTGSVSDWWDTIPENVLNKAVHTATSLDQSNIHPKDYAGAESCKKCHKENYEGWMTHSHRLMNMQANESTVIADFSDASITYLGGKGTFYRDGDDYQMKLERDGVTRTYKINQTIGSRFFQYYVGILIEGPEAKDHQAYSVDHVLPFGFWIDEHEWVPIVHTHEVIHNGNIVGEDEVPDEFRTDPFAQPSEEFAFVPYHRCNHCHTTFALADLFLMAPDVLGLYTPENVHFSMSKYISETTPDIWPADKDPLDMGTEQFAQLMNELIEREADGHAVSFGITCESCHMGTKEHAENEKIKPKFFPASPHLHVETQGRINFGRTKENLNWICGRCHVGTRPQLAGGMATWNSTEYSDAMLGSCYSEMKCVDCHNPHEGIGKQWTKTEADNDQSCMKCHEQYKNKETLVAHTHHSADSEGSRCMNCHMPRLNEGLQDIVRTHMIFSPTKPEMIEANHPNACNQCHTEQPIDWTLAKLKEWYGAEFSETNLEYAYPNRQEKTAIGWLKSDHPSVRLIGADSLARTNSKWAMPELVEMLDDPLLVNRQFTGRSLELMMNFKLKDFGYHFYMTKEERKAPLDAIRKHLLSDSDSIETGDPKP